MNTIKDVAFTFCVTAVVAAAVGMLCGNRLEKSMRYIISLMLICSVLSVVVGKQLKFFSNDDSRDAVSYDMKPLYEYQAEYLVADMLKKAGIECENIKANATKQENDSIVINELELIGCKNPEKAIKLLRETGIDCDIRVIG